MQEVILELKNVKMQHFDLKTQEGAFHFTYTKNGQQDNFTKSLILQKAEPLVENVLRTLKALGKVEIKPGDEILGSMFVIRILQEEKLEEKLYNFLVKICEKARALKRTTDHQDYMKLFDELRMQELNL